MRRSARRSISANTSLRRSSVAAARGCARALCAETCAYLRLCAVWRADFRSAYMSHFLPDFWRKTLNSLYFERFLRKKFKKMSIFVHDIRRTYLPLMSHKIGQKRSKPRVFAVFSKKMSIFCQFSAQLFLNGGLHMSHKMARNWGKSAHFLGFKHFCPKFLKKSAIFCTNLFENNRPLCPIYVLFFEPFQ